MKRFGHLMLSSALIAFAGCAGGDSPDVTSVPLPSNPVESVSVPEYPDGVGPLSADSEADFERLLDAAEELRGLTAGEHVARGAQDTDALFIRLGELLDEELPDDQLVPATLALERFGLIPEGLDLKAYYQELLSTQVGGYFDPSTGFLVIVEDEAGILGSGAEETFGDETVARLQESVLVHEINHYLQDHHFDLEELIQSDELLSDEAVARAALVEGDATLVMYSHLLDMPVERFPMLDGLFQQMQQDPGAMAMSPDLPGAEELLEAPAWVRENLVFPYIQGFVFCSKVRQAGGQKLLDYAFEHDPPRSTEQILHPERWLDPRDEPYEIDLDALELPASLQRLASGTWGELSTRILLQTRLEDAAALPSATLAEAAAGWGGDRFGVWRDGEQAIVGWVTEWDTVIDADEFEVVAASAFPSWTRLRSTPTRLVLVSSDRTPAAQKLFAELQGAPLTQRSVAAPDLAAIGITPEDVPEALGPQELAGLLENPVVRGLTAGGGGADSVAGEDTDELRRRLDDPAVRAAMEAALESAGLGPEALDLLLEDPSFAATVQQMLAGTAPVGVQKDGRFHLEEVGLWLSLPTGEGWSDRLEEVAAETNPKPSLVLSDEQREATLVVLAISTPAPTMLEIVVMGFEAGQQGPGFAKKRGEYFEVDGVRGYEFEYEAGAEEERVSSLQRVFLLDGYIVTVQAFFSPEPGDRRAAELRRVVRSIAFE